MSCERDRRVARQIEGEDEANGLIGFLTAMKIPNLLAALVSVKP
jgi:hypothetical protein